jgi:predicted kinase
MILSPDKYLLDDQGNYLWSRDRVGRAWAKVTYEAPYLLWTKFYKRLVLMVGLPASGKSTWLEAHDEKDTLFVDATFVDASQRKPFVKMAQKYGIPVDVVVMDTPFEVVLSRNALRPPNRKPDPATLEEWCQRLLKSPPSQEEGFRQVLVVPYQPS